MLLSSEAGLCAEGEELADPGLGEVVQDDMGGAEGFGRVCGGDGDDAHAGAEAGLDADVGVLEDDAAGGMAADFLGGAEEDLGVWFAFGDVLGGGEGSEIGAKAEQIHDDFKVSPRGGGADATGDAGLAEGFEEADDPGEGGDAVAEDEVAVEFLLAVAEAGDLGGVAGGDALEMGGDDVLVPHAEGEAEEVVRHDASFFLEEEAPAFEVLVMGVDDDSIPIENGSGHGGQFFANGCRLRGV